MCLESLKILIKFPVSLNIDNTKYHYYFDHHIVELYRIVCIILQYDDRNMLSAFKDTTRKNISGGQNSKM